MFVGGVWLGDLLKVRGCSVADPGCGEPGWGRPSTQVKHVVKHVVGG